MIKYISIGLTSTVLLTAISGNVFAYDTASCTTWQESPMSVNVAGLTTTSLDDIRSCMSDCSTTYSLSSSATDMTPALCMQNVSTVEYMAEFAQYKRCCRHIFDTHKQFKQFKQFIE